jgi:hypothetical protein
VGRRVRRGWEVKMRERRERRRVKEDRRKEWERAREERNREREKESEIEFQKLRDEMMKNLYSTILKLQDGQLLETRGTPKDGRVREHRTESGGSSKPVKAGAEEREKGS